MGYMVIRSIPSIRKDEWARNETKKLIGLHMLNTMKWRFFFRTICILQIAVIPAFILWVPDKRMVLFNIIAMLALQRGIEMAMGEKWCECAIYTAIIFLCQSFYLGVLYQIIMLGIIFFTETIRLAVFIRLQNQASISNSLYENEDKIILQV